MANKPVKRLVAFNASMTLSAIFQSMVHVRNMSGKSHHTVMYAASGEQITALGYYWRFVPENVIVDLDDLGKLHMLDFDRECGINRLVHKTSKWKYNDLVMESELPRYHNK